MTANNLFIESCRIVRENTDCFLQRLSAQVDTDINQKRNKILENASLTMALQDFIGQRPRGTTLL